MLSSIWNLLVTEDELLTKIVTAPTVIVETFLSFNLVVSILKLNYTSTQKIAYILSYSISSLLTECFIENPYNTFTNFVIFYLISTLIFKLNVIKTILSIILPMLIFGLSSTLILNPILKILDISSKTLNQIPLYKLIYLFILYATIFILIGILRIKNVRFSIIDNLDKRNKYIILINLSLGFITLCTQAVLTYYYVTIIPIAITLLHFVLLLSYLITSLLSLARVIKLQITTTNLENAENYNKTLTILYDNVKAFKHDFDNMIFTIGGFINDNDMNGLKSYYHSLEKECQSINNISLLNPNLINNSGIYNLLTVKYKKAKDKNVDVQLEFFFDLKNLHMPIYDFSRMLGIFLDNAIEAAAVSKEKNIRIIFRDSPNSNVQIVQIQNSYINKNLNTKEIFKKGITEKENHLGIGLWEVKQILKRNNNVNLITENNDLYFKQCLEIYY